VLARATVDGVVGSEAGTQRILFVEDEPSIYESFSRTLARAGFEPVVARTASEALELAGRVQPALVLLDLGLPDGDGRDVCVAVRRDSDVPIIILTARGTETDRIIGLELGADDYVVKPFSGPELIARIRAVLRRTARRAPSEPVVRIGDLEVDVPARRAVLEGAELDLTRKEFDVLARLVADAGRVVTREELMDAVWDVNWFGSTKTLDVHIGWLRKKLGEGAASPRYLHTVRGVGFRFSAPEELAP
jgi:two-component system, OmpR family, response regulator RegX3